LYINEVLFATICVILFSGENNDKIQQWTIYALPSLKGCCNFLEPLGWVGLYILQIWWSIKDTRGTWITVFSNCFLWVTNNYEFPEQPNLYILKYSTCMIETTWNLQCFHVFCKANSWRVYTIHITSMTLSWKHKFHL